MGPSGCLPWGPFVFPFPPYKVYGCLNGCQSRYTQYTECDNSLSIHWRKWPAVGRVYSYTPYGVVTYRNPNWTAAGSSANSNSILYTGRTLDLLTSLYYYRARYYDAGLERFIGRDPIGYGAGDDNLYRYVANAPCSKTNLRGLDGEFETKVDGYTVRLRWAQGTIWSWTAGTGMWGQPMSQSKGSVSKGPGASLITNVKIWVGTSVTR